jgi:hypothetical protein
MIAAVGASNDNVLGMTQFLGNYNSSDAVWHDELPFFRQHGPITRLTMYRAFFYDGIWHDPGELKGLQFWWVVGLPAAIGGTCQRERGRWSAVSTWRRVTCSGGVHAVRTRLQR